MCIIVYRDAFGGKWNLRCCRNAKGIVVIDERNVGLGSVLIGREQGSGRCFMVKKAVRSGYEFSGMWAFPGGMIRCETELGLQSLDDVLRAGLARRVEREAGLDLKGVVLKREQVPVVTCYSVGGRREHTLVIPVEVSELDGRSIDYSSARCLDDSVSEVGWVDPRDDWRTLAPANRLIVGRAIWATLATSDRIAARPVLLDALSQCNRWAVECGLHMTKDEFDI